MRQLFIQFRIPLMQFCLTYITRRNFIIRGYMYPLATYAWKGLG